MEYSKIKCPQCGAEYLPEEIFYPDSVFNKVKVVRDENNKIIYVNGESFVLEEEFECEYCSCKFKVKGKTVFESEKIKDGFDEETIIEL